MLMKELSFSTLFFIFITLIKEIKRSKRLATATAAFSAPRLIPRVLGSQTILSSSTGCEGSVRARHRHYYYFSSTATEGYRAGSSVVYAL